MKFSCIMTTFNDGEIILQSIASLLNQTYEDFELLVVDDGSGSLTAELLSNLKDSRIRVIPQTNDGLSSARNRALHHASGDYVCFLDADDTRSPWALAEAASVIEKTGAELLIVRGALSGERPRLGMFFDEQHARSFDAEAPETGAAELARRKAWAAGFEPQSANKFVARRLIERGQLRFPNDHFFEDILFHTMAIAHALSLELPQSRSFTYFNRQLRPQLTSSNSMIRFDILGTVRLTFQMFSEHSAFENSRMRGAVAVSALRLLKWCEEHLPAYHRSAFQTALRQTLRTTNPLLFACGSNVPDPRGDRDELFSYAQALLK